MIICPKTGLVACGYGCCGGNSSNTRYWPTVGIQCGTGVCNAKLMPYQNWGQSIQSYQTYKPVTVLNNENIVTSGDIFNLPASHGKFMPYTERQWALGEKDKLESLNWRMVRGKDLAPGTIV